MRTTCDWLKIFAGKRHAEPATSVQGTCMNIYLVIYIREKMNNQRREYQKML